MKVIMKKKVGKLGILYVFLYLFGKGVNDIMRHDNCIVSCRAGMITRRKIKYEDKET